jgi:multimeric flavodoxin WrbA
MTSAKTREQETIQLYGRSTWERTMNVLALAGSPRKGGNSDILADQLLRGVRDAGAEAEKVYLDDLRIRPIGEVEDNTRLRSDPRRDDDLPVVLDRFLRADMIVIATPVYWFGVSAQVKCFLDRLSSYFRHPEYADRFTGKGYVVLCTFGRNEPDHGKCVCDPMKGCVGVLRGRYLGDLCVSAYRKGEVARMPEALQAAYELGRKAIHTMVET